MPNGTCGVISFGVKGGREEAAKFMEGLKLASIVIHVADLRTCVLHPASTTHRQLDVYKRQANVLCAARWCWAVYELSSVSKEK